MRERVLTVRGRFFYATVVQHLQRREMALFSAHWSEWDAGSGRLSESKYHLIH